MKKIIASVVLALGLVGAANANTYTYYVCNSYFEYKGDDTRYLSDGDRYYHAPSGKYRGFIGVKVRVNDDNSQFAFNDPVFDKTIKSPNTTAPIKSIQLIHSEYSFLNVLDEMPS